jgi:hypothetical protein
VKKKVTIANRVLLGLLIAVAAPNIGAFDLGDIEIHGFVSSTGTKTTDNEVYTLNSTDGDLKWVEAGINFNVEPVEGLRIGMQLYSRTLGRQGDGHVVIDWATGDYRWKDWLGFRIGKNKLTYGLYNTTRDADMTRPNILLPQSIYSENLRDLVNAYLGGEVYGSVPLGSSSDLEYQVFYGTQDINNTFIVRRFMERGAAAGANFLPFPLDEVTYNIDSIRADMEYVLGGALRWHTPLDGLLFGATYQQSEATFSSRTVYHGWMEQGPATVPISFATTAETDYDQKNSYVLSGEYRRGGLFVAAEYWEATVNTTNVLGGLPFPLPSMPVNTKESLAYYGQVAYRFAKWVELSGYYSVYYPDKNDKGGDRYEMSPLPASQAWAKDLTLSARFDITRNMLFKIEGHFIDGSAIVEPIDNPQGLTDEWTMVLARFTFYF